MNKPVMTLVAACAFTRITTTACWNFQEAAMARWLSDDEFLYNDDRDGRFKTVILSWDLKTGETKLILSVTDTRAQMVPQPTVLPDKPCHPLAYHCHAVVSKDGRSASIPCTRARARSMSGKSRPPGDRTEKST